MLKVDMYADAVADSQEWGVGRCRCGRVVLCLGDTQKSFTADQFAELYRLVQAAMQEFGIPPSPRDLHMSRDITH